MWAKTEAKGIWVIQVFLLNGLYTMMDYTVVRHHRAGGI